MDNDVLLEYAIENIDSRELTLSYSVLNGSEQPIFLLTPLVEVGAALDKPTPRKVYAFVDPDGLLHITKRLWYVPDSIDVYAPEVPYLTRVMPGARFTETVVCAVPVQVDYPYKFADVEDARESPEVLTVMCSGLAFSIGYLTSADGQLRIEPAAEVGGSTFKVSYGVAAEYQLLLQGEQLSIDIPAQDLG